MNIISLQLTDFSVTKSLEFKKMEEIHAESEWYPRLINHGTCSNLHRPKLHFGTAPDAVFNVDFITR